MTINLLYAGKPYGVTSRLITLYKIINKIGGCLEDIIENFEQCKTMYIAMPNGDIYSNWSDKILKPHLSKHTGYYNFSMVNPITHKKRTINVHQYIAYCLVDGYKHGLVVNHIDGNRKNNNINNLEWVTQKVNIHKAIKSGTRDFSGEKHPMFGKTHTKEVRKRISDFRKTIIGEKHPRSKPLLVYEYDTNKFIKEYASQNIAAKEMGISSGNIWSVLNGKRRYANGYKFVYK